MKNLLLGFLLLMSFSTAFSQKVYFIYLQSEPVQPFYVKIKEKVHSSAASGYLILSRLRDSSYSFSIGFPQNKWPEQNFVVDIKSKDHGYLLKDFGEKGWGLFDLQTMTIQMAVPNKNTGSINTEPKEVSEFTAILSKAADDPSLREKPVVIAVRMEEKSVAIQPAILKEEVKPNSDPPEIAKQSQTSEIKKEESGIAKNNTSNVKETQLPVVKNDPPPTVPVIKKDESSVVKENTSNVKETQLPAEKKDSPLVVKKEEIPVINREQPAAKKEDIKTVVTDYKRSVISKKAESSTSEGFGLTFLDEYADGKKDTIRIIIPNPKIMLAEEKELAEEEKKFLDLSAPDPVKQTERGNKTVKTEKATEKPTAKPVCTVASDNDFLKLRKRMAAERTDDRMVGEAKRVFKTRCFTVTQLKNLSALFLNDHGRYNFFDLAYEHVADKDNFSSLSAELKDEYYINRFKAMLR